MRTEYKSALDCKPDPFSGHVKRPWPGLVCLAWAHALVRYTGSWLASVPGPNEPFFDPASSLVLPTQSHHVALWGGGGSELPTETPDSGGGRRLQERGSLSLRDGAGVQFWANVEKLQHKRVVLRQQMGSSTERHNSKG